MTPRQRVVVIGAGIAGLAAALKLAHDGHAVEVVERHAAPGGKMRTLPSAAGPVDAGPTVLTLKAHFDALFASVGEALDDHVTLEAEPLLARHWWADGSRLDLTSDRRANREAVGAFAGSRAAREFDGFCDRAAALFAAFEGPVMRAPRPEPLALALRTAGGGPALLAAMAPHRSLAGALGAQFSDPRLAQLFGRYATYLGGSPFDSPAILGLVWQAESAGVWRVAGGMHRLACAVAGLAEARGAVFRFGAGAARLERQGGRIAGVVLDDGTRLAADAVLHAGDPAALFQGLLGQPAAGAVPRGAVEPRALSARVWAFAATPAGLDLAHHNVVFGKDPRTEFDDLAAGRLPADPTIYICAEDRGTGKAPRGPERFEIILNAAPLPAGGGAGIDPHEEYVRCHSLTFGTLSRRGLDFAPPPGPETLTTPAGFAALFPGSAGSLYGRSPRGLMATFRRPRARSALRGLYLAGGGVHPGPGVPMALLSGMHAAAAIATDLAST